MNQLKELSPVMLLVRLLQQLFLKKSTQWWVLVIWFLCTGGYTCNCQTALRTEPQIPYTAEQLLLNSIFLQSCYSFVCPTKKTLHCSELDLTFKSTLSPTDANQVVYAVLTSVCKSLLSKVKRLWKFVIHVSMLSSKNSGRSCEGKI